MKEDIEQRKTKTPKQTENGKKCKYTKNISLQEMNERITKERTSTTGNKK